jgi:RNA polymerase sigma factor (sigma-70 family)
LAQPEQAAAYVAAPQPDPSPVPAPAGFEDFYLGSYREVVRAAMMAGATLEEAEDAASQALEDMLRIWPVLGMPLRYARKAAVSNFIKARTRGSARVARRLAERGHAAPEGAVDGQLTAREGREWVAGVLAELTGAQKEVMQCVADGLDRDEIAEVLGISRAAVRRRLCDARARLAELLSRDGELRHPRPTAIQEAK